jgi:hypothetical protein
VANPSSTHRAAPGWTSSPLSSPHQSSSADVKIVEERTRSLYTRSLSKTPLSTPAHYMPIPRCLQQQHLRRPLRLAALVRVVPTTTPPIATLQPSAAAATAPPQRPHSGAHHSGTTQTRRSIWSSVGLCKLRTDGLAAPRAKLGTTLTLALRLPMSTTKRKKDLLAHNDTPFEAEDEGESSKPHHKTQKVA